MNEQIELDRIAAKEAIARYLKNFLTPERTLYLESLICELDKEEIIDLEWIEIY